MNASGQRKILRGLLRSASGRSRLYLAWGSLFAGTALLFAAVLLWWNFNLLLQGRAGQESLGSSFLAVSKQITEEHMGQPERTIFSSEEIQALRELPGVRQVEAITQGRFPAAIRLRGRLDFSSDIFLSSVPDDFIDQKPPGWYWLEKSREVPLILPSEFLHLYNYGFALSRGLPQLSEASIQALAFDLTLGPPASQETYTAVVAGFSDRITAALVPETFLRYANEKYAPFTPDRPSRLIVQLDDPSDSRFSGYLREHHYTANAEQMKWNRLRSVADIVAGATGLLACMLLGISMLVFVLFIELTISRSAEAQALLLLIGYSPAFLQKFFLHRFLPLAFSALTAALIAAHLLQFLLSRWISTMKLELPPLPGYPVWIAAIICFLFVSRMISSAVKKGMKQEPVTGSV